MVDTLRVSIVLCTYNGAAYLAEQLKTFLTQSRLPDEIIIGDDASSDGTWAIVEAFEASARARGIFVRAVRRPERLGYVANFSGALALASGDVIFLCDQDDAWHPDKLAAMLEGFGNPGLVLLHTNARLVAADGAYLGHELFDALELTARERQLVHDGHAFSVYLRRNIATGAATAFRRELLAASLPIPPNWVHDAWLAAVAAALGTVGIMDDALIDYRQHGANQIGMRRRTLKVRIDEFRLPRGTELHAELDRLDVLADRLRHSGAPDNVMAHIADRRLHVQRRLRMGNMGLLRRIPSVAGEWMGGGYARFATGTRTALRDLLRKG